MSLHCNRVPKVLIVDDSATARAILTDALAGDKYDVVTAANAQEALCIVAETPLDAVLLDMMLPGMSGIDVLRMLKAAEDTRDIPVIVVTAKSGDDHIIKALEAGATDYVVKPFSDAILQARVRNAVGTHVMLCDLQDARVRAEAAAKTKGEFLANMSHEIRTPMTAILGFADLLVDNLEMNENLEFADSIRRNGLHLLEVINGILDLSKIEAGQMQVDPRPCSPRTVITDAVSLMQVRADAKGLSLTVEYKGLIPETICCDPTRLRQIVINLLGNAIKFTEKGKVSVVTSLLHSAGEEPRLQLDVVDTGIGIAPGEIIGLFQPFTQADMSTTRAHGGTGMGLTISKRLAELLGGTIGVESTLGQGSTFSVTVATGPLQGVPMIDAMHAPPARQETQAAKPRPKISLDCRILLAEDGLDNQRLFARVLRGAGAALTVVENGQDAVDCASASPEETDPFDLILMDMQMPVLDGYAATEQLRSQGCEIPIVALTAHAMVGDREKCIEAGCTDYATKPIRPRQLLELAKQYGQRTADSPATTAQ